MQNNLTVRIQIKFHLNNSNNSLHRLHSKLATLSFTRLRIFMQIKISTNTSGLQILQLEIPDRSEDLVPISRRKKKSETNNAQRRMRPPRRNVNDHIRLTTALSPGHHVSPLETRGLEERRRRAPVRPPPHLPSTAGMRFRGSS